MTPQTLQEYNRRYKESYAISGFGPDGVTCHVPCPFCAARDVLTHKLLDMRYAYGRGAKCPECHRGFRAIFHDETYGGVRIEMLQTCGDDPPEYIPIRREPRHEGSND